MYLELVLAEIHKDGVSEVDVRVFREVEKEVVVEGAYGGVGNHDLVCVVVVGFDHYSDCEFICRHKFSHFNISCGGSQVVFP